MGQRVHAPTVLRQQAAGVLHAPVGRRVQGRPAVPIPELWVIAGLEEQPGGQRGSGSRDRTKAVGAAPAVTVLRASDRAVRGLSRALPQGTPLPAAQTSPQAHRGLWSQPGPLPPGDSWRCLSRLAATLRGGCRML